MPALLDVRSLLRSRREKKVGDVFDLAKRLANDESIDGDEILAIVTAAGVSEDELVDTVELVRRRAEYRARAATVPAAEKELAQVKDSIRRHRQALEEAESRYRRSVEPLIAQESQIEARVRDARSAASELMADRNLPHAMVKAIENARKRLDQAGRDVQEVEGLIERQTKRAENAIEQLEADGGFNKRAAQYDDPDRRRTLPWPTVKLVEDVRGGRHQAAEAEQRLPEVRAAHAAALAGFEEAEKRARDF
jgi:hypothetical protein